MAYTQIHLQDAIASTITKTSEKSWVPEKKIGYTAYDHGWLISQTGGSSPNVYIWATHEENTVGDLDEGTVSHVSNSS